MGRWLPLLLCVLLGCEGAASDPGLSAWLRVSDAQFVPGELPEEDGGPRIVAARVPHNDVFPGVRSERVTGALEPSGNAVLIGLAGDTGHWVVTSSVPTLEEPELPSFQAELSFSRHVSDELLTLVLRAVDRDGRVGPAQEIALRATPAERAGRLVVGLRWDSDADLDLHVIDPLGEEVWAGDINSYKQPGPGEPPSDPNAFREGGVLDVDSNAGCVIDGRREENVIWNASPPAGEYTVRVASASLCDAGFAHFEVEAWLDGTSLDRASGISLPSDTREGAGRGDGSLAFRFRVP